MVPSDGKIDHVPHPYDAIYPRQYIAYRALPLHNIPDGAASPAVEIDGNLDKAFWNDVEWSKEFVDISTDTKPKYHTKVKMRWDDDFLYVGMLFVCMHNMLCFCNCASHYFFHRSFRFRCIHGKNRYILLTWLTYDISDRQH